MPFSRSKLRRLVVPAAALLTLLVPSVANAALVRVTASSFTDVTGWNGTVGDVLTCVHSEYTGGTNPVITHAWTRDGAPAGSSTYTLTADDFGTTLVCTETATNDELEVLTATSLPIRLTEPFPVLVTQPSVTGRVIGGGTVSCDGAVFSGYNVGPLSYAWFKAGGGQVGTGKTYVPTKADVGYEIGCRATATNPSGSLDSDSSYKQVEDGSPNVDQPPRISGKATPGLAVTCSAGTWSGDGNTYTYQWLLDEKPIAGATTPRLLLLDKFHDREVTCRVTATNASGSTSMNSNIVSPFHPPILAPIAKVQPKLPKLKDAIAKGITSKVVCNASCATESHAFMLEGDASRLGIRGRVLGGLMIVGTGHANRTYKGELLVTTTFSASAKKGLAKAKGATRVDLLFETAWGPKYSFKMYHVADSMTVKLRR